MKTRGKLASGILITFFVVVAALGAMADPPSRVARLQYISGSVSVQPSGVKDWVEGTINRPLTTSDRVWADKDSRAELHLGNAYLRVDSETSLTLTNVSDNTVQVELDQGTLNVRIRHLYDGEVFEVDTPNMAFTLTKSGDYRFDVDPNRDISRVTVRKGEGEATGEERAVKVRKGESAEFTVGTSLEHQIKDAPEPDGFDDWCHVRNERQDHSQSARYVSADVIGYEDLDDHGTWRTVPTYGAIWVPAVAPGWAPYHYGHWVWVEPWGWTWIDDAPWGFAPCHYGRWVYYNNYWGWVPGPVAVRPVYAPALVAWVGGSHWGVSVSFGSGGGVGWFPLGYGEPYVPAYHVSRNYFQNVNVTNTHITNITNVTNNYYNTTNVTNNNTNITKIVYKNQAVPGAMTAVSKTVITNSQPVARAAVRVPVNEIRTAAVASVPEVAPAKASVLGDHGSSGMVPPVQAAPRHVVSKIAPPERPVPFYQKQEELAKHPGRPLDAETEAQIRARIGGRPMNVRPAADAAPSTPEVSTAKPEATPAKPEPVAARPHVPVETPKPANAPAPAVNTAAGVNGAKADDASTHPGNPAAKIVPVGPERQAVNSESRVGRPVARPMEPVVPRTVPRPGASPAESVNAKAAPGSNPPASTPAPVPAQPPAAAPQPVRGTIAAEPPVLTPGRTVPRPSPQLPKESPISAEPGQNFPVRVVPRPPINSRAVNNSTPVFPNRVETAPVSRATNGPAAAAPAPAPAATAPAVSAEAPRTGQPVPHPPTSAEVTRQPVATEPAPQPPARAIQPVSTPEVPHHINHGIYQAPPPVSRPSAPQPPSQRPIQIAPRANAPVPRVEQPQQRSTPPSAPAMRANAPEPRREPQAQRAAPAQAVQRQAPSAPPQIQVRPVNHGPAQERGTKPKNDKSR